MLTATPVIENEDTKRKIKLTYSYKYSSKTCNETVKIKRVTEKKAS